MQKVLQRFNINGDMKSIRTPLVPHFKLKATIVDEREYMTRVPYASAVGTLMYVMVCTRPNLSQAVSMINRYMHDLNKGYWEAVKWVLWYIKSNIDIGLVTEKDSTGKQECFRYVDSIVQETSTNAYLQ